ncbi:MAG: envelope stress response membrane protein PspB [Verrucomicrobiota bacterium JB022]|nr:envelope stress response membrane protein PspB [Verrucomicrobiota bacterium JB022]
MAAFIPVIVVFIVIGLPVICFTLVMLAKMNRRDGRSSATSEEAALLQEMHDSLNRLEKRIEALETITTDRTPRSTPPPIR